MECSMEGWIIRNYQEEATEECGCGREWDDFLDSDLVTSDG